MAAVGNTLRMWGPILRGMGPPAPTTGAYGALYIDTQTWRLYEKQSDSPTAPWSSYLFIVPEPYRTTLKWFVAGQPPENVGSIGDYALLWGAWANYGTRASFYGPKRATGWPENGEGGTLPIAAPGTDVLSLGIDDEGPALPESTSTQIIATGLEGEVILPQPVDDSAGTPVRSLGLQSGPLQVDLTPNYTPEYSESWTNIDATPADFILGEGLYGLTLQADVWNSVDLRRVFPDGTVASVLAQPRTEDGYSGPLYLPGGTYRLVLTGTTGLTGALQEIALRTD